MDNQLCCVLVVMFKMTNKQIFKGLLTTLGAVNPYPYYPPFYIYYIHTRTCIKSYISPATKHSLCVRWVSEWVFIYF